MKALRGITVALLVALTSGGVWAQDEVQLSVKAAKQAVTPGEQLAIAVVFDHKEGWHIHPHDPVVPPEMAGFVPIPTEIKVTAGPNAKAWATQWPTVHHVPVNFTGTEVSYGVYEGRAIAYVPIQIAPDASPGSEATIQLAVSWQACDDSICVLPEDRTKTVRLSVVSLQQAAALPTVAPDPDFAGFDLAVFSRGSADGAGPSVELNFFGVKWSVSSEGAGALILLMLVGAVGGFLLNLTPCVLPVIPLKVMGLSQAAGNPARCVYLGAVLSLGMVAFFLAMGSAIAFVSGFTAISSLFQTGWFAIAVGAFIAIMALGMFGLFTTRVPQWVYQITPNHETAWGSFLWGILMAVLSTPCTAPFMGAAAAWAATQSAPVTMGVFGSIGAGMALPYLILSANPRWIDRVPRTGPASELVKQVMGLLLLAVAAYFLGTGVGPYFKDPVDPPSTLHWWVIAGLLVGAGILLAYRAFGITRSALRRLTWTLVAAFIAGSGVYLATLFASHGPVNWIYYTPARLAEAQKRGDVVVMDFTAEWCLNCKALEAGILYRPEVVKVLNGPGVTPIKVDLTGHNPDGKSKLKELGWVGIPLLVISGPGAPEPEKFDSYTVGAVLEAIERARGPRTASANPRPRNDR